MACNDTIKQRCKKQYGACIAYEKVLPEFSQIENDCPSIEEVGEDLYNLIGEIKEETDLSSLTANCITLPTERTILTVMQTLINKICAQEEVIAILTEDLETAEAQILALQENLCP